MGFVHCDGCDNLECRKSGCMGAPICRRPCQDPAAIPALRERLPGRRELDTVELVVGPHLFDVSFGYFEADGRVSEIFFSGRLKSGQDLDTILMDLGIAISRGLQVRPEPAIVTMPAIAPGELTQPVNSAPVTIAFGRHERTGDLVALGIRAPDAPGLDAFLVELGAALSHALGELPDIYNVARPVPGPSPGATAPTGCASANQEHPACP